MSREDPSSAARAKGPGDVAPGGVASREPCLACGEETAAGSVFYSDRRTIERRNESPTYLCVLCDARLRATRRGRQLTDDEVHTLVQSGSLLDLAWKRF